MCMYVYMYVLTFTSMQGDIHKYVGGTCVYMYVCTYVYM